MRYFNIHNHSHFSNNRFLDSMNTVHSLLINAKKKGMAGIALTDHGVLSGMATVAQMMDNDPDFFNGKDGHGTFRPVIGSEIYLDDFSIIKDAVDNNKKTKFFHFVLTAKDDIGLHALRIISSNSWGTKLENIWNDHPKYHGFFFRGMRRLPTYKDWLSKLMDDPKFHFKGHVIASTACLGSELSQSIVNNDKPRAKKFIKYIEKTFGKKNCYFEMMPAHRKAQEKVNSTLWDISHGGGYFSDSTGKGIPCIISTDAHYIDKNDRQAHSIFLKSENPNRDVADFYKYAHLFTYDELKDYFPESVVKTACKNSLKLLNRYAPIWHATNEKQMKKLTKTHPNHPPVRLHYLQEIPDTPMPKKIPKINLAKYAKKYHINWNKYPYFKMFVNSKSRDDQMYMWHLFSGIHKKHIPLNNTYLSEINWELMTLHQLTLHFHMPMSSYFNTVLSEVVKSIWSASPIFSSDKQKKRVLEEAKHNPKIKQKLEMATGSILGSGRGSAGEWVTSYIIGITQVNSVKWHLWAPRFSCRSRALAGSMPDIDLDSESSKRLNIMHYLKSHRGSDRVLNFSTFNTQAAKSTIYTACRGLKINYIDAKNIANLLPPDARGMGNISIHDALFGNKKNNISPATNFIKAVEAHPGLKSALLNIGGKIRGVSEHASGVALFNEPYTQRNAMMKTNKAPGIPISQVNAGGSAYLSSLKYDYLTLSALDRIHEALRLLLRNHKIKWLGNLHDTYLHYFGPQALDFTSKGMYDMLFNGSVINAFEFSSLVGRDALLKMHATDFSALVAANALMRLTVDPNSNTHESHMMKKYWGKEQPINRYVRYRDNPGAWDKDMKKSGLTKHEMNIMHHFLDRHRGVCYSQEDLMKLAMRVCYGVKDYMRLPSESKLSTVSYKYANTLRKAVAKKDPKILEQARQEFYSNGKKRGVRTKFLDYVWYNCAVPAKNYSFNLAHGVAYTINLIVEMNICYRFGPIYWQTACLSVNAGMYGDSVNSFKNPNYNKLCHALSNKYIADKLINPDINHSAMSFVPYKNHILYGLYPISGIGTDDCEKIIKNRPYKSFNDFIKKTNLSKRKNIQLIKAGCFTNLTHKSPRQTMIAYVNLVVPNKKRLTTTQIPKIKEFIPKRYAKMVQAYDFRSHITGRKKVPMNNDIKRTYLDKYSQLVNPYVKNGNQMSLFGGNKSGKAKSYSEKNGKFKINIKAFNKWYNKFIKPLKNWLKTKEAIQDEARLRKRKLWKKYCLGNPQAWEMDALGCYIHQHELSVTNIAKQYHITPYNKISKKPIVTNRYRSKYTKRVYTNYKRYVIYGTVIGKNAHKALVYLMTPNGIANVRVGKWRYPTFNKKITKKVNGHRKLVKDTWFNRGTKLLCVGHRINDNFFLNSGNKKYSVFPNCLFHIKGYSNDAKVYDVHGNVLKLNQKVLHRQQNRAKRRKQVKADLASSNVKKRIIALNIKFGTYYSNSNR